MLPFLMAPKMIFSFMQHAAIVIGFVEIDLVSTIGEFVMGSDTVKMEVMKQTVVKYNCLHCISSHYQAAEIVISYI